MYYTVCCVDIEMSIVDKSTDVLKYIQILERAIQSVKTLKVSLPDSYSSSLVRLMNHLKALIDKAGELSAFLASIEEIKNDVSCLLSLIFENYGVVCSFF